MADAIYPKGIPTNRALTYDKIRPKYMRKYD